MEKEMTLYANTGKRATAMFTMEEIMDILSDAIDNAIVQDKHGKILIDPDKVVEALKSRN